MGRRIVPIEDEAFLGFEHADIPYPLPLQQQAWLGLLIQNQKGNNEPTIWFIHFPLDEQGKLVLVGRDDLIHRLVRRVGEIRQSTEQGEKIPEVLEDNPYAFRPKPDRMAVFHAKLTALLDHPPSHYYQHTRAYFSGELGWDQWSFLGYQGIADLAVRMHQDNNDQLIAAAIAHLPPPALEPLCHCLENARSTDDIAQQLLSRTKQTLAGPAPDPQILTACIRGISFNDSNNLKLALVKAVLSHPLSHRSDILAAICGRAWEVLCEEGIRDEYLQRLADNDQGQSFFNNILSDLLFLPDMRQMLLSSLRQAHRPAKLSSAIGEFFKPFKQQ